MLRNDFDFTKPYNAVNYLRMSTEDQNKRSPDQQEAEIAGRIKSLKLPWRVVKSYREPGITGRLLYKRVAYKQMLRELKSGIVKASLVLVDTLERFGRIEELPTIRKQLYEVHGIVILTADTNFADPNSASGRIVGTVECLRATEDGRIKAHCVFRGKRDAVQLGHWPGSAPPFGYRIKSVITIVKGREEVDHAVLVPSDDTAWIIKLLFSLAEQTGHGTIKLARALNSNPEISECHKPFQPETIGYWLDNEIYMGVCVWPKSQTGIVNDRVLNVRNEAKDITRYEDFCEPLVSREQWVQVQSLRQARRDRKKTKPKDAESDNVIRPLAPGLALHYLLSGLVCCGLCGAAMTVSSSQAYTTKDGRTSTYPSYVCPGFLGGHCKNAKRVPEGWLREQTLGSLCGRVFPQQ